MLYEKQIVTDLVPIDICDSTLIKLKHDVEKLIEEYGEGAWITIDVDGDSYVEYNRLETDSEFDKRIKKEEERKKFRKKQYEDLKKEFEKENNYE